MLLVTYKARQLILSFPVDFDTHSSSTLSLTLKLPFQCEGISVTALTSEVSCGCFSFGDISLLWWW